MKNINQLLSLILCFALSLNSIQGQTRKELEKKRKKTEAEIAFTKKVLRETTNKKQKSIKEIKTIARLIEAREQLLNTISAEIGLYGKDISTKTLEKDSLKLQIEYEKKKYAKAIVQSYKSKKVYNNSLYLFTAKTINQLIHRLKFTKYLSAAQEKYMNSIQEKTELLSKKIDELMNLRESKKLLAQNKQLEVKELESDKSRKDKVVKALDGKESELRAKLAKQNKAKQNLNSQIDAIIALELKKEKERQAKLAREKAKKDGTKVPDKPAGDNANAVTPEVKLLSNNFAANKGKLPWPVEKGFISERFGNHAHEKLDQVTVQNNGVDIQTTKGSKARCIHKGTVTAIITIPGMGKAVIVNHGEYYTVYSKLSSVSVSQGESLALKQEIGTIMQDEDGVTEVHLEIWYNQDKQNPEIWIAKK
jgi:septal ring factor EnvC (AmiA/AmiB activator)